MRWVVIPLMPLLLAGCGGAASDAAGQPVDPVLRREMHAGDLAFAMERNDEAAAQYREALDRAEARDDAQAIGDAGYDLTVVELRTGKPADALAAARATHIALPRRGVRPFPALLLAEATALYRYYRGLATGDPSSGIRRRRIGRSRLAHRRPSKSAFAEYRFIAVVGRRE